MHLKRISKAGTISNKILVSGVVEATICLPHLAALEIVKLENYQNKYLSSVSVITATKEENAWFINLYGVLES